VPGAVTRDAESIDTSALGTPDAEYLSSGCDIASSFTGEFIYRFVTDPTYARGRSKKGMKLTV
jgi:hypothetical protein